MVKFGKEAEGKAAGAAGSVSGAASILGSWQVCHSVCLGLVALLGVVGITVNGMPLFFLTKVAVPLWLVAVVLLGVVTYFYFKRHCISKNLLLLNSGLIVAGIPFKSLQQYQQAFWVIGGGLALAGILLYARGRIKRKKCGVC